MISISSIPVFRFEKLGCDPDFYGWDFTSTHTKCNKLVLIRDIYIWHSPFCDAVALHKPGVLDRSLYYVDNAQLT